MQEMVESEYKARRSDPLRIALEIEIWPYYQMVYV